MSFNTLDGSLKAVLRWPLYRLVFRWGGIGVAITRNWAANQMQRTGDLGLVEGCPFPGTDYGQSFAPGKPPMSPKAALTWVKKAVGGKE